ncbi:TetR/AcrR family transcriptional regulator [Candidatus Roizmanbacteria bacterium]|nr:TetR/AcrR family transcriptional regulator [Candidatus Roizmanbacteria bacterium]
MIKKDKTRGNILKAAEKIFARDGFSTASIDDIAALAGIAKGTVYYHFKSKDELFFEIVDKGIDQLAERIQQKLKEDELLNKSPLYTLVEAQFLFFKERKDFCKVLFSELWRLKTKWRRDIYILKAKYHQIVLDIIGKSKLNSDTSPNVLADYIFWLVSMVSLNTVLYDPGHMQQAIDHLQAFILRSGSGNK